VRLAFRVFGPMTRGRRNKDSVCPEGKRLVGASR
jgi:hypothetical protein